MHVFIFNICMPHCSKQFAHTDINFYCFPYPLDSIYLLPLNLPVGATKLYRVTGLSFSGRSLSYAT